MPKKMTGVLSPDKWAIEYARKCLSSLKAEKGAPLDAKRIKSWIASLKDAEKILLKIGDYVEAPEGKIRADFNGATP